ncbi:MAG: NADAR domain-containing protein [Actinomycetota bacterium]|nr:NADAR domain-containing protein [Actinomycetota bacterium]
MDLVIESFDGERRWLSNYADIPADYDGVTYPTAEHAFAAAKTLDLAERKRIAGMPTPGDAKAAGQNVELRPEWDKRIRYEAMWQVLASKFSDPKLLRRLTSTGDLLLVETNCWHDQHWGDCICPKHREMPGQNHLGRALMALRALRREDRADRWTRVGITGHRDLGLDAETWVRGELGRVMNKLRAEHDTAVLIDGMAMGADVVAAEAALGSGLRLWAYMPFPDQTARWPATWIRRQEEIRSKASRVVVLGDRPASAGGRGRYVQLLHGRNRLIVRDCDALIAVHDRSRTGGGTATTVDFAREVGLPIITVDPGARGVSISR